MGCCSSDSQVVIPFAPLPQPEKIQPIIVPKPEVASKQSFRSHKSHTKSISSSKNKQSSKSLLKKYQTTKVEETLTKHTQSIPFATTTYRTTSYNPSGQTHKQTQICADRLFQSIDTFRNRNQNQSQNTKRAYSTSYNTRYSSINNARKSEFVKRLSPCKLSRSTKLDSMIIITHSNPRLIKESFAIKRMSKTSRYAKTNLEEQYSRFNQKLQSLSDVIRVYSQTKRNW